MSLNVDTKQQDYRRSTAEVPEHAGVLAYGDRREEAMAKAETLALRLLAKHIEQASAGCQPRPEDG